MEALRIVPELEPVVALGAVWLEGVAVAQRDVRLDEQLAAAELRVRQQPPATRIAVRRMFSRLGIDPTRTRPASEALLRRVCRGERLPRVHALVDVCNWCSLELQLPYGLYDGSRLEGAVVLRVGRPGEQYQRIGQGIVHVAGRLVLVDVRGPFGNPTADSARTLVTAETTSALAVVFAPREIAAGVLPAALDLTSARAAEFTGAREAGRWIV